LSDELRTQAPSKLCRLLGRFLPRLRQAGGIVVVQGVVQFVSACSGFIVIRSLSASDFALYTLIGAIATAANALTNLGLDVALLSVGGRYWPDTGRISRLYRASLLLRRRLVVCASPVIVAVIWWVAVKYSLGPGYVCLLMVVVFTGCILQLETGLALVVLRLQSRIRETQVADALGAGLRAVGTVGGLLHASVWSFQLAQLVSQAGVLLNLRRLRLHSAHHSVSVDPGSKTELWRVVRQVAPNVIFSIFQGQIALWLLTVFGQPAAVAGLGALGRLSLAFSLLNGVVVTMIQPHFAKLPYSSKVHQFLLLFVVGFGSVGATIVGATLAFPDVILALFGPTYRHLGYELQLYAMLMSANALVLHLGSLVSARGWVNGQWIYIPLALLADLVAAIALDVSSLSGAIWFGCILVVPSAITVAIQIYFGRKRELTLARGL
jgi:O-antigen/teichoic acid export membrane protein